MEWSGRVIGYSKRKGVSAEHTVLENIACTFERLNGFGLVHQSGSNRLPRIHIVLSFVLRPVSVCHSNRNEGRRTINSLLHALRLLFRLAGKQIGFHVEKHVVGGQPVDDMEIRTIKQVRNIVR